MRFVSQYKMFGMQVRPIREMVLATGQTQVQVEPIYIRFWQGDITEKEVAAAEAHWQKFAGRTVERDMMTPTSILARLSVFDTDHPDHPWANDEVVKEMVEQTLLQKAGGKDYIYVEREKMAPPWPTYDSFKGNLNKLLERINEDGYTLEAVLAYEQSPDGPQREAHIAFLGEEILKRDAAEEDGDFIPAA
jgi:hypothetical protein